MATGNSRLLHVLPSDVYRLLHGQRKSYGTHKAKAYNHYSHHTFSHYDRNILFQRNYLFMASGFHNHTGIRIMSRLAVQYHNMVLADKTADSTVKRINEHVVLPRNIRHSMHSHCFRSSCWLDWYQSTTYSRNNNGFLLHIETIDYSISKNILILIADMTCVSVIVPVYNTGKYLKKCLDSIFCQDYPRLEVIVIDDCSTDNSRQVLVKYKSQQALTTGAGGAKRLTTKNL